MKRIFFLALLILVIAFIWCNSLIPSELSMKISDFFVKLLDGTITRTVAEREAATTLFNSENVRKLAHFSEFALFGMISTAFTTRWGGVKHHLSSLLFIGLFVALSDETIQLFTGRTSMVRDVWIDFAGFVVGLTLVGTIFAICRSWKKRKSVHSNTK